MLGFEVRKQQFHENSFLLMKQHKPLGLPQIITATLKIQIM